MLPTFDLHSTYFNIVCYILYLMLNNSSFFKCTKNQRTIAWHLKHWIALSNEYTVLCNKIYFYTVAPFDLNIVLNLKVHPKPYYCINLLSLTKCTKACILSTCVRYGPKHIYKINHQFSCWFCSTETIKLINWMIWDIEKP